MNIFWVTSEAVPFAKTGGLADVSGALPDALAARGHNVSIFMPWYPQQTGRLDLKFSGRRDLFPVPSGSGTEWAAIRVLQVRKNLTVYFLEFNKYFDRPPPLRLGRKGIR